MKNFTTIFNFLILIFLLSINLHADNESTNNSCNGELIHELNSISVTTSHTERGTLYDGSGTDDDDDYYYFTPGVAGTLSVNSYTSNENTDLYISTSRCNRDRVLNDGRSYSTPTPISVGASDTIYIRIKRERRDRTTTYRLPMTFTPVASSNTPTISLSCDPSSLVEGNSGTQTVTCTVSINEAPDTEDLELNIRTLDNSATTADNDYGSLDQDFTFNQNTSTLSQTFSVTVNGDTNFESDETFNVEVRDDNTDSDQSFTLPNQTTITILNDDISTPNIDISPTTSSVTVGTATVGLNVNLSELGSTGSIDVEYTDNCNNTTGTVNISQGALTAPLTINTSTLTVGTSCSVVLTGASGNSGQAVGSINPDTSTITITTAQVESTGGRDFELRHQENLYGNVEVIGNTVLCIHDSSGECVEQSNTNANNHQNLQKAPNSWSELTIPTNAEIVYARIYWQGRKKATTNDESWDSTSKGSAKTIKLKKEGASNFTTMTADVADFDSTYSNAYIRTYSASANAIDALDGSGKYYVDTTDFYTHTGETDDDNPDDGLGAYGAWVLVVVYRDPDEENARNVTIFDGFKQVTSSTGDIDIPVSGFLTPKADAVDSKAYVFTAEGDKYIDGDQLKMSGATFNTTLKDIAPDDDNAFDSRVDVPADRSPNLTNNNGIDIQIYDVGTTTDAQQIITNDEVGANFRFTSDGDTYFPSLIVFSTEVKMLDLCYDYTYGQNGYFYSAADVEQLTIEGTFDRDTPLEVKLYIENRENSDVIANDLYIHIEDINTTIASYERESTYAARPNQNISPVPDSGREVADGYDRNISIGNVRGLEHFYTYYSLDLKDTSITTPIHAKMDYDLSVTLADGSVVDLGRQSIQLEEMEICQATSSYLPVYDRFNVVHVSEEKNDGEFYLNLPTQVAGRTGNYYLESMDPDNLDVSKPITAAIVAVEMIDVDGFHYATATCTDENAIVTSNERVWSMIEDGYLVGLDKDAMTTAGFFNQTIANAAFRISYNLTADGDPLDLTELSNGDYKITNFPDYAQGQLCQEDFIPPTGSSMQIVTWCGNNGQGGGSNGMDPSELATCMECIYGLYTKKICSRDNFSIRPEAYNIALSDMDQTDDTMKQLIDTNTPAPQNINLVAGYEYHFEVNATDHHNNMPTPRYNASDVNASLKWSPIVTATDCNDDSNITGDINFYNGTSEKDIPVNQVGKYSLEIVDSSWTKVDHVDGYREHQSTSYFRTGTDCVLNSNAVQTESSSSQNGCDTSSVHTNIEPSYQKSFTDMNVTFHPYKFDVQFITPKIGPYTRTNGQTFVYMDTPSTLDADNTDMSYNMNGTFSAVGYTGGQLSNFVTDCYADDVNLDLSFTYNSPPPSSVPYLSYSIQNTDTVNNTVIRPSGGSGLEVPAVPTSYVNPLVILQEKEFFAKDMNGSITMDLGYNFPRTFNQPLNPRFIEFHDFNITHVINSNSPTTIYADLTDDHKIFGNKDLDDNVTFVYGRAKPSQYFYDDVTESSINTPVSAVVYCVPDPITCSAVYNINTTTFGITDEYDWYLSLGHITSQNDGNITLVVNGTSGSGFGSVNPNDPTAVTIPTGAGGVDTSVLVSATGATRPQDVYIDFGSNTNRWLIYNEDNNSIPSPFYRVRFIGQSDWAGHGDTGHVVDSNVSSKKNRRLGW